MRPFEEVAEEVVVSVSVSAFSSLQIYVVAEALEVLVISAEWVNALFASAEAEVTFLRSRR